MILIGLVYICAATQVCDSACILNSYNFLRLSTQSAQHVARLHDLAEVGLVPRKLNLKRFSSAYIPVSHSPEDNYHDYDGYIVHVCNITSQQNCSELDLVVYASPLRLPEVGYCTYWNLLQVVRMGTSIEQLCRDTRLQ